MGTYYRVFNSVRKEYIEPNNICTQSEPRGGCIKAGCIILGPIMHIAAFASIYGRWQGDGEGVDRHSNIVIVGDYSDFYDGEGYADVTKEVVEDYAKWKGSDGDGHETVYYKSDDEIEKEWEKRRI